MRHSVEPGRPSVSAQAPPAPISAGRAYAEVLLVFAVFFAASIISAGETLAGRVPVPTGGWGVFVPSAVQQVSNAAIAAALVILLSARRGITLRRLGARLPQGPNGEVAPARVLRMAALALLALLVGGLITSAVATGHLPRQAHPTGPYLLYAVAESLFSGVVEEMVVLAFVVTTLRQAGRPVPEILIVAVLLRCSYHIYYGAGVIGIVVWATAFVFLFLRFGSVIPLIVIHIFWDAIQFLALKWAAVGAVGELAGVLLLVAGLVAWLADVFSGNRDPRPPPPPPGPPPPGYSPPPGHSPPPGDSPPPGGPPPPDT